MEIQDPGAKAAPSSRRTRGFGSLVSAVGVVLVLVTMAVWWLSRELDERVLVAAQPYLATDVRIGSVEVSLWSSWPNVEVVLRDVWVEDAIHRGEAFLEMERVGVVMACWPLISGRMEVQEVRAEQGKVNLERSSDGRENWRFWKAEEGVDGDNEGMEWGLEAFRLDEVQVEGSWWQTGSASAVTWSANCRAMSGWLDGPSEDSEAFMVSAESDLFVASFSATGKEWLRQVEVSGEVEMELNGGELWVGLDDATVTTDQGPVRIQGEFSDEGGFSMALVSEPAAVKALMAMVPEGIFGQIEEGKMPEGLVAVDVRVGLGGGRSAWSGPVDESWSGSWAVRIRPEELKGGVEGVEYSWISGEAVVHDIRGGWRVQAEGLRAKLAEGEAGGDFTWTNSGRQERLEGHVEWRIRLHRLCEDWDRLRTVLEPWRVGEGSVFAGGADGVLERRTPGGPWEWSSGQWNAGVQDAVASMEGTSGQGGLQVVCAEIEAGGTPSQMSLTGRGVELPGFSGALMLEGQGDGDLSSVDVQAEEVDVEVLMAAWEGQSGNADFGEASGLPLKWSGSIGVLRWGALQATAVSAEGALNAASGEGTIRSVEGKVFGGQVDATGRWNRADIAFNGRLMGAAIPELRRGNCSISNCFSAYLKP